MTDTPLKGLRIVVTRPRAQAFSLAQGIEAAGGIPLILPLLEIAATEINQDFSERLHALPDANFVIFISPNAVRFGLEALRRAGVVFSPSIQIAAVGQGTVRALREAGCRVALVPETQFDSEGLLALPALQQIDGQRMIIVRGEGGRELLAEVLRARGARVDYLECYARRPATFDGASLLAEHPDVLTVTSSEALDVLWDGLDDAARAAILDVPLLVIHPRIAARAHQHGWRNVQTTAAGDDGLLAGLIAWAAREN
ncbi:MAG: uroporphyrinogen-III synthase [Gallionella sp.]|nr:uroporphyrinogen-III synthase [Gallionella sp.]